MKYDLEERCAVFAEKVIGLCKRAPKNTIVTPIISQLVRSGTSIGANYMEANGASSKRDFNNKACICRKECRETKYWLRILAKTEEGLTTECRELWAEAHELTLIFSKIVEKSK